MHRLLIVINYNKNMMYIMGSVAREMFLLVGPVSCMMYVEVL